ncbi:disco-interacting protein 2 homolog C [Hetaerina americana]|uniref:disco-interacting protein 2 homolog C n=1 Tax=Hetaerina americana TaxID=62018 RepID=UPI003A7F1920
MKPITFENLRRLMGGGRKKKDRAESSFKRSDSFKRISIKRHYHERGNNAKAILQQQHNMSSSAAAAALVSNPKNQSRSQSPPPLPPQIRLPPPPTTTPPSTPPPSQPPLHLRRGFNSRHPLGKPSSGNPTPAKCPDSPVIGYRQWIHGMKDDENGAASVKPGMAVAQSPGGGPSSPSFAAPHDRRRPTPPPRTPPRRAKGPSLATESPPAGGNVDILVFDRSPVLAKRRSRPSPPPTLPPASSEVSPSPSGGESFGEWRRTGETIAPSVGVSLGRIWMDPPPSLLSFAPRSLELPSGPQRRLPTPPCVADSPVRQGSSGGEGSAGAVRRPQHHSLDSALKERRETGRPLSPPSLPPAPPTGGLLSRTLSSTQTTQSGSSKTLSSRDSTDRVSSSKDSGFSFSISIPRLSELTGSSAAPGRFFKSKKSTRPKPSVSRDGYFKRTSSIRKSGSSKQQPSQNQRVSSTRRGKRSQGVGETPSTRALSGRRWKGGGQGSTADKADIYQVVIGRPPRSLRSLKLDPMIFVPPEKRRPRLNTNRKKSDHNHHHHPKYEVKEIRDLRISPVDPGELRSDAAGRVTIHVIGKDEEVDDDDVDEGLYECVGGEDELEDIPSPELFWGPSVPVTRVPPEGTSEHGDSEYEEGLSALPESVSEEDEDGGGSYVPLGVSPVPRRRPVRRRKSAARRNVKYVARRSAVVVRAPSTLRRRKSAAVAAKKSSDITQKGYEKKRSRLLSPYVPKQAQGPGGVPAPISSRQQPPRAKKTQRRVTHNEKRYHSEVRQEAVQQALAAMQGRPKPSLPMPSKRTSVMARSPDRERRDSASSSDEDSVVNEGDARESTPEREMGSGAQPPPSQGSHQSPDTSSTGSARDTPPQQRAHRPERLQPLPLPSQQQQPQQMRLPNGGPGIMGWEEQRSNESREERKRMKQEITDLADVMQNLRPYTQPPDVTHNTAQSRRMTAADRVNRYNQSRQSSASDDMGTVTGTGRWKVSAKIQQLLNTLKRPKRRPLPEFYEDDDIELEIAANPKDPNAPKPEGGCMTAAVGEQLVVPSGLPRNLEAAIQRYGSATYKAPVATVLDPNGKLSITLTYGKLLSRSQKIAYTLLNKAFSKGDSCLKSGDRVALVYPNNDPINFICAFYGCLQAGIVPVPIEVPLTRRDAGSQQIGFLLGSCGIQVALTSEACLKGLPKTAAGEVVAFKGWPKLQWFVTEHLAKTPKEWLPPPRLTDDTPAYIEYTTDKDGSAMGVTVTRSAMLAHCRTLTMGCNYTEGEVMVCVLDFKREVGLWHSVLASVLNGMHVVFIPYALMKVNPASWMQMITKYRASVAVVKSRDLHWGLLATKDHKEVSLASLRLLLVADGANPWSLSSCDQFLSVFQSKGLRSDAICPCASSSEVLTVSIRRPGRAGVNSTGRGVLSMSGLSYGVVRVDQENSLTSLTLQDCGQVMPGCVIVVVKIEGQSYLCKTDEVGEICVQSAATGNQYWGLQGLTNSTFRVQPLQGDGKPLGEGEYVRSGLLGFLGPGGLVFVCGSRDGLMTVTGRKHNADDIIATVLAVEPMKFIYRGRIAVFSIRVLRDERICVIAEQRPDCSEEESFQWMSRVLQAVDSIHQVGIYCLALVPPNYLPKTPLGGIHLSETKRRFLEGTLHPANVLLCPHTTVTNLPKPREIHAAANFVPDVGPASVMVGNIVQGNRLASAQGRDMGIVDEESDSARKYQFISEILRWRAMTTADHVIFTLLNSKGAVATMLSCSQLHKKAERVGCLLLEKGKINTGDHVALIYPPGVDLICAFYGCLYVGAVPVTIRPPHPQNLQTTLPTVRMIVDVSKSVLVLSNQNVIKLLKSKEASNVVDIKSWPLTLDTDDTPKKKLAAVYRAPTAEMLAYLDFSVSTTGMLAGIKMSHAAVTSLCRSMKLACELYPSRHIALCLDPYCGLGFALWCLSSIYSGHHSILIPPSEVEVNPALWLTAVSQNRVRDTFCSYGVMELCTKGLGSSVNQLKQRGINLGCVRTCVVVAEERPRMALTNGFSKLFSALGLSPRAVSTSFGCRVNVAICLQGASSPEPSTVYVDLRALRNDRVSLVERGSPHSLCLMESGKLLPGVKVIIANPDTKGQCGDSHLGEIWVQSSHNASGYFTIFGDDSDYGDHFNARLVTGSTGETYARTGYLGFLRRTECVQSDTPAAIGDEVSVGGGSVGSTGAVTTAIPSGVGGELSQQIVPTSLDGSSTSLAMGEKELHDAVFVVGALDETIMLRGMRYHPIDIENSVLRSHKKIAECAVFTWTNLLVVVVELDGNENEALDLVPLVTNAVLEEHHLVVGVAVVVDPGVVPVNSRGEKQRMHLRDGFLADQLDPIYVAYNM